MILEQNVDVGGTLYPVVISDSKAVLLTAKEDGKAVVGYLHPGGEQDLSPAVYLVENPDLAGDCYLKRVVRRHHGWPWPITKTGRLAVREFHLDDLGYILKETGGHMDDRIFTSKDTLRAYIRSQYGFYEYGIWAVVRKEDNRLIGKAGVTGCGGRLELGYHIFKPYRNQGYATEASRAILTYVAAEFCCPVYAKTRTGNVDSVKVLKKLGFTRTEQTGNPPAKYWCQYVWNC